MIVFVDFEHASGRETKHGQRMLAARTTITYRLEDLSGVPCHLIRYDRVDDALLDSLNVQAIFISGNSAPPEAYTPEELEPIETILRETERPVFGFCGGFQLLAQATGMALVPLSGSADGDRVVTLDDGRLFEYGYHPVDIRPEFADHPLLAGLGSQPVFRHAHGLQVQQLPAGFETLAATPITPIQLAAHVDRKVVGAQFHPEYWTDEHPAGRTLIANFLRWAELPVT